MLLRGLLAFNLLFVVNQIHFPWDTGIPGLAPANILMVLLLLAMMGKEDVLADVKPMLTRPLLYFGCALLFAFVWAELRAFDNIVEDLTRLKNAFFYPIFYFVFLKCRQDAKWTRYLIIWILVVAAVAGLEAVREGIDYGFDAYAFTRRASGPFGVDWHNANRAGVFYAMFNPMFVALALFLRRQKLWRIAAIGGIGLLSAGALFTYSRQAYFLILLGIALLLLRRSIILVTVVGFIAVSAVSYLPDAVFQRVEETQQVDESGNEQVDASTASRWEIWAGAMHMLADHPIGVGLGRFSREIGNYSPKHKGYDAHNFYVLMFAEGGLPALLTVLYLMGFLFFVFATFLRQKTPEDDPERKALALGFTVTTLCTALGGIYGSPTLEGAVMAPYWALCGLLERYTYLAALERAGDGKITTMEPPSLEERFPLAAYIRPGRARKDGR